MATKLEIDNIGLPVQWGNASDVCYSPPVDVLLSMSVIEDIKAEIKRIACEEAAEDLKWAAGLSYSLKIIDKHISRKEWKNG